MKNRGQDCAEINRPDEDEFQPDILKLRDGVLEMFYRFVTNDPN